MKTPEKKALKTDNSAPGEQAPERPIAPPPLKETEYPSPTELAMIAVALRRNPDESRDFPVLASDAFRLWEACERVIRRAEKLRKEVFDYLPKPNKYPMTLKKFLELMPLRKRPDERLSAFRHYWMDRTKKNDITEVADSLTKFLFETETAYHCVATEFLAWIEEDKKAKKKLAAAKAGKGKYTQDDARRDCRNAIEGAIDDYSVKEQELDDQRAWQAGKN